MKKVADKLTKKGLHKRYVIQKMSITCIARMYKVGNHSVSRLVIKYKLSTPPLEIRRKTHRLTKELFIRYYFEQHKNLRQIAKHYGVTKRAIEVVAKKHKIRLRTRSECWGLNRAKRVKKIRKLQSRLTSALVENIRKERELSQDKLASKYRVSKSSISNILRRKVWV